MDNVADKSTKFNKSTFLISFNLFRPLFSRSLTFSQYHIRLSNHIYIYIYITRYTDLYLYTYPSSTFPFNYYYISLVDIASLL